MYFNTINTIILTTVYMVIIASIANVLLKFRKKKTISSSKKAVLITGCDSGFGNRLAFRLNAIGFRVYATVLDSTNSGSQELRDKCKFKDQMIVWDMNVTNEQQINECFDKVKTDLDKSGHQLWAVVNNAGVITTGHLEWGTLDEYKRLFEVNVFGVVRVTRKFIPLIRLSKGRIIITASIAGRVTIGILGVYSMTKHAIISFSDSLRQEMNRFHVKVSTIEPFIFKTSMFNSAIDSLDRIWNQTDQSVREVYGEKYHKSYRYITKRQTIGDSIFDPAYYISGRNIDIVVDDMIDAITNTKPQISYKPVDGILMKIVVKLIQIIPSYILDKHFALLYRRVPEFMKNRH